jgi:AraC-like DNA-binding protein
MAVPTPPLEKRELLAAGGLTVADVRCRSCRSSWSPAEEAEHNAVVFVRRGCFRRRTDTAEVVADAASVYFERPGEGYEIAHPHEGGDACTQIVVEDELLAAITGDEPTLPRRPAFTPPAVDLEHRLLLGAAHHRKDELELAERAISLLGSVLAEPRERRSHTARDRTAHSRRRTVDAAREAITASPAIGLLELAGAVAVSPHHLSRIFRAETGETLSRYRNRVRVRLALERLADGEDGLTRLAAELGFADHAHLTRTVRAEAGSAPSALRTLLRTPPDRGSSSA